MEKNYFFNIREHSALEFKTINRSESIKVKNKGSKRVNFLLNNQQEITATEVLYRLAPIAGGAGLNDECNVRPILAVLKREKMNNFIQE